MTNNRINANKLNPFYIEDTIEEEGDTWDGDWQNDEDNWEEEGLLD